ncbi:hypothetical protein [Pseudomonas aeruginosa]|uniref:hypothetical protein n=1 Tax=Pseudomonas aeruginosa TaxID=287 RepID=UPI0021B21885|nr:hypothetical protein [Pseudomonas aeruginosa]MCT7418400.1 hypothetical protein [Pseudomonas aeruginosa]
MANALTIRIETTGVVRSGNSKAGNEYHMCEAFGHLPGIPYPQRSNTTQLSRMKFCLLVIMSATLLVA